MDNLQNSRGYFKKVNHWDGNYFLQKNNQRKDITKRTLKEKKEENEENENKPLEKQNFKWCNYLEYLI